VYMPTPRGNALGLFLLAGIFAGVCAPPVVLGQSSLPSVRSVHVLDSKNAVEVEVEASDRLVPQTRVLTGPDRLVVDFPNALPGNAVRNQVINRGEVKSVRVGLFQSSPPVTRVVLDLKTAQSFQVFPYGRTVIIKVTGGASVMAGANGTSVAPGAPVEVNDFPPVTRPGLVAASYTAGAERVQSPGKAPLEVIFRNGLLTIRANRASLSEILFAVHQRTGAEVAVAAGAEAEQVVAEYGPGPAPEVLARLLNGSRFNFLILSSPDDPQKLERVILSVRGDGVVVPLPPMQRTEEVQAEPPAAANVPDDSASANAQPEAPPRPQMRPDDSNPPD
jgi:hypothetical protein